MLIKYHGSVVWQTFSRTQKRAAIRAVTWGSLLCSTIPSSEDYTSSGEELELHRQPRDVVESPVGGPNTGDEDESPSSSIPLSREEEITRLLESGGRQGWMLIQHITVRNIELPGHNELLDLTFWDLALLPYDIGDNFHVINLLADDYNRDRDRDTFRLMVYGVFECVGDSFEFAVELVNTLWVGDAEGSSEDDAIMSLIDEMEAMPSAYHYWLTMTFRELFEGVPNIDERYPTSIHWMGTVNGWF